MRRDVDGPLHAQVGNARGLKIARFSVKVGLTPPGHVAVGRAHSVRHDVWRRAIPED